MSGRVLALDVGGKRIGVAISDPDRISRTMMDTLVPWLKDKLHVGAAGAGR